jgi:hypothetical protein
MYIEGKKSLDLIGNRTRFLPELLLIKVLSMLLQTKPIIISAR